jgi:hypothetical protein
MTDPDDRTTPHRRRDVLSTVRGLNLSGTRDRPVRHFEPLEAGPGTQRSQDSLPPVRVVARHQAVLSVKLGSRTEVPPEPQYVFAGHRYTEPND